MTASLKITTITFFIFQMCLSQNPDSTMKIIGTIEPVKFFQFSANGGLVLNNAYSHFEKPSTSQGHFSREKIEPLGGDIIKPGFWLGLNTVLGRRKRKFVAGLSLSLTEYQYKYISSYNEPYRSLRFPSAQKRSVSNIDVYGRTLCVNYELGIRRRLSHPFSIQHLLVIQSVAKGTERLKGNSTDIWETNYPNLPNAPPNFYYSETTAINRKKTSTYGALACYRFTLFVNLQVKKRNFELMFFRNIALSYRISVPLWGIGINYPLRKLGK